MQIKEEPVKTAFEIATALKSAGFQAYFVGGAVRDDLMGKTPQDVDIATSATPDDVEKLFPKTIPVGKQFGVMLVVSDDRQFEVATFRKEGGYQDGRHPGNIQFTEAKEDALRRDFTVNGLFYDPFAKKIIDFVEGEQDIKARLIRAIGDPSVRFEEDKLRMLRAIRFASTLDFEIEHGTWEAICEKASDITQVSPERIRDELIKIFTRPGAARGYQLLHESGLMKIILPEIEAMRDVDQPPEYHPEGDVFIHTGMLLEKLKDPSLVLAFSALLHDVAKPVTHAIRKGKITFYEHAPIGAKMAEEIMKRLRFSNKQTDDVSEAVANHMKFGDVQKMRSGKLKKFVSRPNFDVELELHRIDCLSSHGKLDNYYFLIDKIKEYEKEDLKPRPLINGHDLLGLGMKAGPAMKPLLEEIYELQLEGSLKSKDEALRFAKKSIPQSETNKTGTRKRRRNRKPAKTRAPGKAKIPRKKRTSKPKKSQK